MSCLLLAACSQTDKNEQKPLLAEYGEYKLYEEDIPNFLPKGLIGDDSTQYVKAYTRTWVLQKLMVEKALVNLREQTKTIETDIQKYREELYVTQFEELVANQKLDTLISQQEIELYYEEHKDNFVLRNDVAKIIFAVLPESSTNANIKRFFASKDSDEFDVFKDFVYEKSHKFYVGDDWVSVERFKQELPPHIASNPRIYTPRGAIIPNNDELYFIKITNLTRTGNYKPIEMAYEEIAAVLLHKRKIDLIKSFKNKLYDDALHKKKFTIY